jgi:hypothetical protein
MSLDSSERELSPNSQLPINSSKALQPLDRIAMTSMAGLAIVTLILLWSGDRTLPKVRDFNWQNRTIGAEETAFTLTFNRPVDRVTVEKQLKIQPPLPGKISWSGSKLAYTLSNPAPYGKTYRVSLTGAREAIGKSRGKEIVPFQGQFQTPDRVVAYISTEATNRGRIVSYNFTTQTSTTISPVGLVVTDFKIDRSSQIIVFSAIDPQTQRTDRSEIASQQIYRVSTGIADRNRNTQFTPPGKLELILDNRDYQNIKFDLTPDGKKIVVQRSSQTNPNDLALWVVTLDRSAPPTELKQSGDFVISPDSSEVAAAAGEGVSIFPIVPMQGSNLDYLPRFGRILSFAADGKTAATIEYNSDYTKSLFIVNNDGIEQQIIQTDGSIVDAKFSPTKDLLYYLTTNLKTQGKNSDRSLDLAATDLQADRVVMKLRLPMQQGIQMSLSPDGLALMFDRVERGESTDAIVRGDRNGSLWLVPIPPNIRELNTSVTAARFPLSGWHPRWLP